MQDTLEIAQTIIDTLVHKTPTVNFVNYWHVFFNPSQWTLVNTLSAIASCIAIIGGAYAFFRRRKSEGSESTELKDQQVLKYLKWLQERCGKIELRGIKREGQQVVQLDLEKVYVPLEAVAYRLPEERGDEHVDKHGKMQDVAENQKISLNQVLQQGKRVTITGGPGCGKTTVLLHIAWALAKAIVENDNHLAEEKVGITADLPLPIFVPLSEYASYLNRNTQASAEKKTLASFLSYHLIQKQSSFDLELTFLQRLLRGDKSVILLLDGLDEVADEAQRVMVRQAIEELVTGRENMRVVVTCRTVAYKNRTALGKEFREIRVQPLAQQHVEQLIKEAYAHIYRHDPATAQNKINELVSGIKKLEENRMVRQGKDSQRLVISPLMMRMLLIVHFSERRLPEQRAELYMKAADAMLLPEYLPEEAVANQIGGIVGGSKEVHRDLVQHIAFGMYEQGDIRGRDILEDDLLQLIKRNESFCGLVKDFMALTRLRGTLLEERMGSYRFIHLAFQEYLAARYLAEVKRSEAGVNGIVAFFEKGLILESWWREPALLVSGYLNVTSPQIAQMYLRRLAGITDSSDAELTADVKLAAAEIAATALLEWPNIEKNLRRELVERLTGLFNNRELMNQAKPTLRAQAGDTLARLGDPRLEITTLDHMPFCFVPAGPFWMGSYNIDKDDIDREKQQHLNEKLNYDYWISCYPVTVVQYQIFVNETGKTPKDKDSLNDPLNRPVRYLSWYEAMAFCDWLTKKWQRDDRLPKGWRITLPSEAEWEKAARGGIDIPVKTVMSQIQKSTWNVSPKFQLENNPLPKRFYPWGDQHNSNAANYDETQIGSTNSVGCFPNRISPYGCEEMSGNVWEWTRSLYREYPYNPGDECENLDASKESPRVLRGGAFDVNIWFVRCAFRYRYNPNFRYDDFGFRLVVSPCC